MAVADQALTNVRDNITSKFGLDAIQGNDPAPEVEPTRYPEKGGQKGVHYEPDLIDPKKPDVHQWRVESETNLKGLTEDQYKKAWQDWLEKHPNDSKAWDNFQLEYGTKFDEQGHKIKPGRSNLRDPDGGKLRTKGISTSEDQRLRLRSEREEILNHIFGSESGDVTTLTATSRAEKARTKKKLTAHHLRGLAEDGPWIDFIIEHLRAPKDSLKYKKGLQLLDTAQQYFADSPLAGKAGTTLSNLSMLEGDMKTGAHGQAHDAYDQDRVTAERGVSPLEERTTAWIDPDNKELGREFTSKGITLPDGTKMSTIDYIRSLPTDRETVFRYTSDEFVNGKAVKGRYGRRRREGLNFFSSWYDHIELSSGIREDIDKKIRTKNPGQGRAFYQEAGNRLNKHLGKLRSADVLAQMLTGIATGNVVQTGVSAATLASQTKIVQKNVAKVAIDIAKSPAAQAAIQKLLKDRAKKTLLKTASTYLAPGADVGLSYLEAKGYLMSGKIDQAVIAGLSGAVGWAGPPGDFLSALLDGSNTALDIVRLDLNSLRQQQGIDAQKSSTESRVKSDAFEKGRKTRISSLYRQFGDWF